MKLRRFTRLFALFLVVVMTLSMSVCAINETNADRLYDLGLFRGTGNGYALENTATRIQGLIMLIRLLGEEEEALSCTAECPFTDVSSGDYSRYAAYAYQKGYTLGVGDNKFDPHATIGFKHYVTFILRALGYNDSNGDFTFNGSLDKAVEIGLMDEDSAARIVQSGAAFYRADLVDLSIGALTMNLKDSKQSLAEKLVGRGVFSREQGKKENVLSGEKETYHYRTMTEREAEQAIYKTSGKYTVASGTVTADVIIVDVTDPSIRVEAALVNDRLGSTKKFSDIVAGTDAEVVINGNFFEAYNSSKFPIGHLMVNGEMYYGDTGITGVGFTEDGTIYFGRPKLFFFVEGSGYSWACYSCNTREHSATGSVLYNSAFGTEVTAKNDGVATTIVDGVIATTAPVVAGDVMTIPQNGYLMYFSSGFASTHYYRTPVVGTAVSVTPRLTQADENGFVMEGVTQIVSGGPRLVENGAICTELEVIFQEARFTTAVTSRTAIGKLGDGKLVIVSTNEASIQQMRELMLQLGCVEAVNLDGGGSTALAYQGKVLRSPGRELTVTLQIFED